MDYSNIVSAKYTFGNESVFCVVGTDNPLSVSVPVSTGNTDYQTLMQMVVDGDLTITEADV